MYALPTGISALPDPLPTKDSRSSWSFSLPTAARRGFQSFHATIESVYLLGQILHHRQKRIRLRT